METTFFDMFFTTSAPLSTDQPIKHNNNEPLFSDWNCNQEDADLCLNMYDQFLGGDHEIANDYSNEWESCSSDDLEDEHEPDVHELLFQTIPSLTPSNPQILKKDVTTDLINFCQSLPRLLPKFCDFDQIDPKVKEEMNATENDTVNMDLLTCSAATANCYRESSHKPIIKSKSGKWSCNGKFNPAIGLGPLSQLFTDIRDSNKMINDQNRLELAQSNHFQTSVDFVPPTVANHYKVQTEFEYRDYDREITTEFPDCYQHQVYYNRDYNSFNDSQNNYCAKNTICNDKCYKNETQSHQLPAHCQQMSSNSCGWHFNYSYNNYNCEPNLIQPTFY